MPRNPLISEIASIGRGRDITRGYVDPLRIIEPTDQVLREAGGLWRGLQAYDELLRDGRVRACIEQRILSVVARPTVVEPGGSSALDRRAAELVEETLYTIGWDRVTCGMLMAVFYGFAVAELMWESAADGIRLREIKVRDRSRFAFRGDGALLLRTQSTPEGEELPPKKFWVVSVGATHDDEPYGRGLAHNLYWPVRFKRELMKMRMVFAEKFAAPTVLGKFPPGTSPDDREALLEACQAVATDAGVIVPEGMSIELLEAARSTSDYQAFVEQLDREITMIILGQTMTVEDGSSRAQAQVHRTVRQEILRADADLVCESANRTWVRWLVDAALPGAAPPRIFRDLEEPEDLSTRADRDLKLMQLGYRLRPESVARIYGDDYELVRTADRTGDATEPSSEDGNAAAPPVTEMAERSRDERREPIEVLADLAEAEVQPLVERWIDAVRALADRASSLEELRDLVVSAYGWLPRAELVAALRAATMAAVAAGWIDAEADARARRS